MTHNPQACDIIRNHFNNKPNIMTPHAIAYRMVAAGNLAIELSTGEGIMGAPIYGVTVVNARKPDDWSARKLSESFDSQSAAESYIESLRNWRPE